MAQQRKPILTTSSKYQEKVLRLLLFPWVFLFAILSVAFVIIMNRLVDDVRYGIYVDYGNALMQWLRQYYGYIVFGICAFFIMVISIAFKISHDLIGPFARILNDLDAIIEGRLEKKISVRPKDQLAKELLKRVNVLIEKYIETRPKS